MLGCPADVGVTSSKWGGDYASLSASSGAPSPHGHTHPHCQCLWRKTGSTYKKSAWKWSTQQDFSVHLTLSCLPSNQGEKDSGTMSTYSGTSSVTGTPLLLVNLTAAGLKQRLMGHLFYHLQTAGGAINPSRSRLASVPGQAGRWMV